MSFFIMYCKINYIPEVVGCIRLRRLSNIVTIPVLKLRYFNWCSAMLQFQVKKFCYVPFIFCNINIIKPQWKHHLRYKMLCVQRNRRLKIAGHQSWLNCRKLKDLNTEIGCWKYMNRLGSQTVLPQHTGNVVYRYSRFMDVYSIFLVFMYWL